MLFSSVPKPIPVGAVGRSLELVLRDPTFEDYANAYSYIPEKNGESDLNEEEPIALSADRQNALFSRLEGDWMEDDESKKEFHMREKSLKMPNSYTEVEIPFPPPEDKKIPEELLEEIKMENESEVRVLLYSPEGDLRHLAPKVSITFSHDMVPLSSVSQVDEIEVPIKITPNNCNGRWRWLGTKTIVFEPEHRLNYSTEYTVEIQSGMKSVNGATLSKALKFSFTTPTLKMNKSFPSGSGMRRENLIGFIEFDQRINPEEIIKFIRVKKGNNVQLLKAEDVKKRVALESNNDSTYALTLKNHLENAIPDQHLFFLMKDKFEVAEYVTITLQKGAPSLEGPRKTENDLTYSFSIYPHFMVNHTHGGASPFSHWFLSLSNPIDEESFDLDTSVTVTPSIPFTLSVRGQSIQIMPQSRGNTIYTVKLDSSIKDIYGQNLSGILEHEFAVKSAMPSFRQAEPSHFIWDPTLKSEPKLTFTTVNHESMKFSVFHVEPSQYDTLQRFLGINNTDNSYYTNTIETELMKMQPFAGGNINTMGVENSPVTTELHLRKYIQHPLEGFGQILVHVTCGKQASLTWVQVTRMALDMFSLNSKLIVWVNSLEDGSVIKDAKIQVDGKEIETDGSGVAEITISGYGNKTCVATRGKDTVFMSEYIGGHNINVPYSVRIFNDRGLYRPNEEVHFKGFVRRLEYTNGIRSLSCPNDVSVRWELKDSVGRKYLEGSTATNEWGSFHISVESIPDNVNLGYHTLQATVGGNDHYYSFHVEEFRTPEFHVTSSIPSKNYIVGDSAVAKVVGKYYSGGPLSYSKVTWNVSQSAGHYTPPGFYEFNYSFGSHNVHGEATAVRNLTDAGDNEIAIEFKKGITTPSIPISLRISASVQDVTYQTISSSSTIIVHPSSLYVGIKTLKTFVEHKQPLVYRLAVTDIDGNEKKGTPVIVTVYKTVSVRSSLSFVEKEIVDSEHVVTFTSSKEELKLPLEAGKYTIRARVEDAKHRSTETSVTVYAAGGSSSLPGSQRIDAKGLVLVANKNEYNPGDEARILVQSPLRKAQEGILLVSLQSIIERRRFTLDSEGFAVLPIEIKDGYAPSVIVSVEIIGQDTRIGPDGLPITDEKVPLRPGFGYGTLQLSVSTRKHVLTTDLSVPEIIKPGSTVPIEVHVQNESGESVKGAEVTLVAVDVAVLSLTGYKIQNPIALINSYYGIASHRNSRTLVHVPIHDTTPFEELVMFEKRMKWSMGMQLMRSSNSSLSFNAPPPAPMAAPMASKMAAPVMAESMVMLQSDAAMDVMEDSGDDDEMEEQNVEEKITARKNIKPIAAFIPHLVTDENGRVRVEVQFPDNLTRYRVTVVVVSDADKFGYTEKDIVAQLPFSLRPSYPRFLNFGDKDVVLHYVLENQTDKQMDVEVAIRALNLEITSEGGYRVSIRPNGRRKLHSLVRTVSAGEATIQVVASVVGSGYSDAITNRIPVFTPATSEAFATYGEIDQGTVCQSVVPPKDIFTQFGGLEVTTSSTAITSLTESFLYLVNYPFECIEQTASRLLSLSALYKVLQLFKIPNIPSAFEVHNQYQKAFRKLANVQRHDGSFGYWDKDTFSPLATVHVAHALIRCRNEGIFVHDALFNNVIRATKNIKLLLDAEKDYTKNTKLHIRAYAIYVLSQMEMKVNVTNAEIEKEAMAVYNECDGILDPEALAWICIALCVATGGVNDIIKKVLRDFTNRIEVTPSTANFITSFSDPGQDKMVLLRSSTRTDAIILDFFLTVDPQNVLIPKFVRGLEKSRGRQGYFRNTQENIFSLIALRKYFDRFESITPDFVAHSWIQDIYIGEMKHSGRTTESQVINVPMRIIADGTEEPKRLILSKEGVGRLYYRLGLNYALRDFSLPAESRGFTVLRKYEGITSPDHVKRLEDGTWLVEAGELVRVTLSLSNSSRRYHVALVDKLPAGFEAINENLQGQEVHLPKKDNNDRFGLGWWWWRTWYDHVNLRDERVEAFSTLLWEGSHEYSYICRATAQGTFVVPPCQAEEMYSPEIFGRTGYDVVKIHTSK